MGVHAVIILTAKIGLWMQMSKGCWEIVYLKFQTALDKPFGISACMKYRINNNQLLLYPENNDKRKHIDICKSELFGKFFFVCKD